MPLADLRPPNDLYFLLIFGPLFLAGGLSGLLAAFGLLPPYYSLPIVGMTVFLAIGLLFLGGAAYIYRVRSREGEHPLRPWRDALPQPVESVDPTEDPNLLPLGWTKCVRCGAALKSHSEIEAGLCASCLKSSSRGI